MPQTPAVEFLPALRELYEAAGSPAQNSVVRYLASSGLTTSSLSSWLTKGVLPRRAEDVRPLIEYLEAQASRRSVRRRGWPWWERLFALAKQRRARPEQAVQAVFVRPLPLPPRPAPSVLLRSDYEVVGFHGRDRELSDLLGWAMDGEVLGVRLVFGPGGQGKTRLAQELVDRLGADGWTAGRLRPDAEEQAVAKLLGMAGDLLVVLDYAETQFSLLRTVLQATAERAGPGRCRILLLARAAGQWWDDAERYAPDRYMTLLTGAPMELPAMLGDVELRRTEFAVAVAAFASVGGYDSDGIVPPEQLDEARYASVLQVHMTALAMLLDREAGVEPDAASLVDQDPALRVIHHEQRYWQKSAIGLPDHRLALLNAVMTAVTCCGAPTREAAVELLAGLPDLQGETPRFVGQYADWAHELSPGDGWLSPLAPDLLGEYFVASTLRQRPDLAAPLGRSARAMEQAWRLVTIFGRAAQRHDHLIDVLGDVLRAGPDQLWAVAAIMSSHVERPDVLARPAADTVTDVTDPRVLWAVLQELPDSYRCSELRTMAAAEALRRSDGESVLDAAREAALKRELANGLTFSGRPDEALAAMRTAVELYERLAAEDADRHQEQWIGVLVDLGGLLSRNGRHPEALRHARRTATLAKKHLPGGSVVLAQMLAEAYTSESLALKAAGNGDEAVKAAHRAVQQCTRAMRASKQAELRLPTLIMNLSNRYSERGWPHKALSTIEDAVRRQRRLEERHPDPLLPNLAQMLINYACCLSDCGRPVEARAVLAEATGRLQVIAAQQERKRAEVRRAVLLWAKLLAEDAIGPGAAPWHEYEQVIALLRELGEDGSAELKQACMVMLFAYGERRHRAGETDRANELLAEANHLHSQLFNGRTRGY